MSQRNTDTLYLYYQQKGVLPTHARFSTKEDLDKYQLSRSKLFSNKLHLPPQMFQGANMIEFGPDSGENSLVFARWDASLTLVEPNPNSWPYIENYFKKFGLGDKLKSLVKVSLESFETTEKFRFIDAEGFIYTIRPESIWINLFNQILEKDGFFIIFYMEAYSSLIELILKLVYTRVKGVLGHGSNNIAWKLFKAKWNSIPHTRSFDSWVMDVLDNPFVRLKYLFSASSLSTQLSKAGFSLYSSWPNYIDFLSVYWHKTELSLKDKLANNLDYIARSRLSFAFGKKLFLCSESKEAIKTVGEELMKLLSLVDQSIDEFDEISFKKSNVYLDKIKCFLADDTYMVGSHQAKLESLDLLESIRRIFELLIAADTGGLISFCNSDRTFIKSWGLPSHFAVFRKN